MLVMRSGKMIINKTSGEQISSWEITARNLFSQSLGLMFHPRRNLIMKFKSDKPIYLHNWFVFYPLEVIILNEDQIILEINPNFKPFHIWNSRFKGRYVLELGEEYSKGKVKIGDKIKIG